MEINNKKVVVEEDLCTLYNYEKILSIKQSEIITSVYHLCGDSLKVVYVDGIVMKIKGNIEKILRTNSYENI